MNTIYIVPIEPLEERYTGEWYRFLPSEFMSEGWNVVQIDGTPTTDAIETGSFLDINSTIHYKAGQMQKISELFRKKQIKEGDVFFISDLEFWGIESLRMLSQINGVPIKIYGFLHAASYTKEDAFAVAADYQKYTEIGWLKAVDGVFVGTHYHKRAVWERRIIPIVGDTFEGARIAEKIHVVGNPLFMTAYDPYPTQKRNKIVITNRFDSEKRPDQSLLVARLVKEKMPDVEVVVTTSRPTFRSNKQWLVDLARMYEREGWLTIKAGLTKQQYHDELRDAKVMISNSIEENFGYCIAEAILFGVSPILCRGLSHDEMVQNDQRYLFTDIDEAVEKVIAQLGESRAPVDKNSLWRFVDAPKLMGKIMRGETIEQFAFN